MTYVEEHDAAQAALDEIPARADAEVAALTEQLQGSEAEVADLLDQLAEAAGAQAALQGALDAALARVAALEAKAAVPAGFASLDTFPGATFVEKLAAASGDVYVPAGMVTPIDAAWTNDRRILVTIAKAVTRLRFAPGSVLRINPNTSKVWTKATVDAQATTPLSILQQTSGQLVELTGLTLEATPQGHNYHGWSLFNVQQPNGLVDIKLIGGAGTGGAPPAECFEGTLRGATGWTVRVSGDGNFADGTNGSAVGVTFQRCLRCVLDGPALGNWRASTVVFYQSALCGIQGGRLARSTVGDPAFGSGCHLNLEQTVGTWLKGVEFVGGVPGSDVTISMAGDNTALSLNGETFSLNDAVVTLDDCKGGASWPGSTKDGLVTVRYWGQDVTKRDSTGKLVLHPDWAPGGRYASLGVTLDNIDAKGYPLLGGRHVAYDGKPAGVVRTAIVRQGGVAVPSFTSAYGKTMVGPGGQLIPATA